MASENDEFRLVYKVNSGKETGARLMVSKQGAENNFAFVALPEAEKQGEWYTATIKASALGLKGGDVIGCAGLSFQATPDNYEILLGEFAFVPSNFNETPVTPQITYSEVMKRVYNRADFKVVFDMPFSGTRKAEYDGCPIYNEEVGAWYYEIFVKQGEKETLLTTTTSWAAYVVDAPLDVNNPKFQIGVRAVGKDGKTKSPITWTNEIEAPLTLIDTLTIDKDVIKPNETFTIGFEDPNPVASNFKI